MRLFLILAFALTSFAQAGSFDRYQWRLGFKLAADEYQPTLLIEYDYKVDGESGAELALPRSSNMHTFKLQFKVDGSKVDPVETEAVTYWSLGEKVPVYLPPPGAKTVGVSAIFTIANLFVVPAAPTAFTVACKKLTVGFAPVPGFQFGGTFVGEAEKFARKKIGARAGEPSFVFGFDKKNVKATTVPALLLLFPKLFLFNFDNLGGVAGYDESQSRAGSNNAMGNNLKAYSMVFYREDPSRDWAYAPTWLQQESIYFPFGVEPGGRTKTRSLFIGASDERDDLLPWQSKEDEAFSDLPTEMDVEFDGLFAVVEKFREQFSKTVKVDASLSPLITQEKDGNYSPAMANMVFASEMARRLKIPTVPAFLTTLDATLIGKLPLGGFSQVVTAFSVKGNWFLLDAADPSWGLKNAHEKLAGKSSLILDGTSLRIYSY